MHNKTLTTALLAVALMGYQHMAFALGEDWDTEIRDIGAAVKPLVKQVEMSGNAVDDAMAQSAEAWGKNKVTLQVATDTYKTAMDYFPTDQNGYALGMPPQLCTTQTIKNSVEDATAGTDSNTSNWSAAIFGKHSRSGPISFVTGSGGSITANRLNPFNEAVKDRMASHDQLYCTQSEADAGICTFQSNGLQGADADISAFKTDGSFSGPTQAAATQFAARIAPVITPVTTSQQACATVTCATATIRSRKANAIMASSRNTLLRYIESRTPRNQNGDAGNISNVQ